VITLSLLREALHCILPQSYFSQFHASSLIEPEIGFADLITAEWLEYRTWNRHFLFDYVNLAEDYGQYRVNDSSECCADDLELAIRCSI